jgi:hypothetical protein
LEDLYMIGLIEKEKAKKQQKAPYLYRLSTKGFEWASDSEIFI